MNRCSPGFSIAKSIDGFVKFKTAEGLSPNTIVSYEHALCQWMDYIGDRPVEKVTTADIPNTKIRGTRTPSGPAAQRGERPAVWAGVRAIRVNPVRWPGPSRR